MQRQSRMDSKRVGKEPRRGHTAILLIGLVGLFCRAALLPVSHADNKDEGTASSTALPAEPHTVIVISASRVEQSSFDLPASIDRIDQDRIQDGAARINLSEPLQTIPGVVAQNRQNYAQDLQISIRGFGARSTFGVRGVRLYADDIPATMPDGQGQTSHFDLNSTDRIEVLRGPYSALYGNSSGGVISLFTEDGQPGFRLQPSVEFGSYGTSSTALKASGEQGKINYLLDAAHFTTDGYREHSAATRDTANAKLRVGLNPDSSLTLITNGVSMQDIQDPLGLTRGQFESSPRGAHPNALLYNTRKSVSQDQLGLKYDNRFNAENEIHVMLYGGARTALQFLAIPPSAQTAPTSSGGVVDLARQYNGLDLRWTHHAKLNNNPLTWTAGLSYDNLDEERRGYENFSGSSLGVQGDLRRSESNNVYNVDEYLQAEWQFQPRWLVSGGLRNNRIAVRSDDDYITTGNGDDSGATQYRATNAVLGTTFKASERLHLYLSYGQGFETPTLNELAYRSGSSSGLNFDLKPSSSENYEAGIKTFLGANTRANLAIFHIDTDDEIVVLSNTGGRSVYQNATRTHRNGAELSLQSSWSNGAGALLSYSWLRAEYAEAFCNGVCGPTTQVAAGNRLPGVPDQTLFGELSWRTQAYFGFNAAIEAKYSSAIYVNDINSDSAPAYFITNLRVGFAQTAGAWNWREFARLDNIGDRHYAGSVIVNEGNQRYFEPAPGRNYLVGVSASYSW